jgi:hypothetical protein
VRMRHQGSMRITMGQVVISLITTESWLSKRSSAAALLFSLFHPYISMFISTCSSLFMLHLGLENVRGEAKLASPWCSAPALGRCCVYYVGNPLCSAHFSYFCTKFRSFVWMHSFVHVRNPRLRSKRWQLRCQNCNLIEKKTKWKFSQ